MNVRTAVGINQSHGGIGDLGQRVVNTCLLVDLVFACILYTVHFGYPPKQPFEGFPPRYLWFGYSWVISGMTPFVTFDFFFSQIDSKMGTCFGITVRVGGGQSSGLSEGGGTDQGEHIPIQYSSFINYKM